MEPKSLLAKILEFNFIVFLLVRCGGHGKICLNVFGVEFSCFFTTKSPDKAQSMLVSLNGVYLTPDAMSITAGHSFQLLSRIHGTWGVIEKALVSRTEHVIDSDTYTIERYNRIYGFKKLPWLSPLHNDLIYYRVQSDTQELFDEDFRPNSWVDNNQTNNEIVNEAIKLTRLVKDFRQSIRDEIGFVA